jgi:hypothetical protein
VGEGGEGGGGWSWKHCWRARHNFYLKAIQLALQSRASVLQLLGREGQIPETRHQGAQVRKWGVDSVRVAAVLGSCGPQVCEYVCKEGGEGGADCQLHACGC